jgi:hypothetical protein
LLAIAKWNYPHDAASSRFLYRLDVANSGQSDRSTANGVQIYAFDTAALSPGRDEDAADREQRTHRSAARRGHRVQRAAGDVAVASEWSTAHGGTEFTLSALDFAGGLDNRIARWALTNTSSLTGARPAVQLSKSVLRSEVYGIPPMVQQRPGPTRR